MPGTTFLHINGALDVPSKASITNASGQIFSRLTKGVTPLESTTANNVALKDTYLDQGSEERCSLRKDVSEPKVRPSFFKHFNGDQEHNDASTVQ